MSSVNLLFSSLLPDILTTGLHLGVTYEKQVNGISVFGSQDRWECKDEDVDGAKYGGNILMV